MKILIEVTASHAATNIVDAVRANAITFLGTFGAKVEPRPLVSARRLGRGHEPETITTFDVEVDDRPDGLAYARGLESSLRLTLRRNGIEGAEVRVGVRDES